MDKLKNLRDDIDKIDERIVKLLEDRMDLAKEIGILKHKENINILDENREKIVIEKIKAFVKNNKIKEYMEKIYMKIMEESKNYQKNNKIEGKDEIR